MQKTLGKPVFTLILIFLGLVAVKSIFIQFFPSPWIFSDEQSYFGMAQKIFTGDFSGITNSHGPGYSIIISPSLVFSTVAQSYLAIMVINIVVTSGVVFLAYALFRKKFYVEKIDSLIYSTIVALLPQFILFNYVVMSEAFAITLIYAVFAMMLFLYDERFKKKTWIWLLLGVCVGFSPIVRTQFVILLVLFSVYCIICFVQRDPLHDRKKLSISFASSIATYLVLRYLIFPSTGSYSDLRGSYVDGLLSSFSSIEALFDLVHIFAGELSFYFVATLLLPTLLVLFFLVEKSRYSKYRGLCIFWILFIMINTAIVTLHANSVHNNLGIKTIYARYLDPIIPIVFSLGLMAIHRFDVLEISRSPRKLYLVATFVIASVALTFFSSDNIFANTFTIYIHQFFASSYSLAVFSILAMFFLFLMRRGYRRIVAIAVGLFLMVSTAPAIYKQHEFSRDTYSFYSPLGRWFDENRIKDATIYIDKDTTNFQVHRNNQSYDNKNEMDYVTFYATAFWSNMLVNNISVGEIDLEKNIYYISDRLLPRKILSASGSFTLYGNRVQSYLELDFSMLGRFGEGLMPPDVDWVWMDNGGSYILDMTEAVIPTAQTVEVEVHLKGLYPPTLDKQIEVVLNGESLGIQSGHDNFYRFTISKPEPFLAKEIEINAKTWDPITNDYSVHGEGLGLDLEKLRVDFK